MNQCGIIIVSLSLSLAIASVSLSRSLIQLLVWQMSKGINEVRQRKEGFTGRGIVGSGSEMRIWCGVLTVYLNECLFFGLKHQYGIRLRATTVQLCFQWLWDLINLFPWILFISNSTGEWLELGKAVLVHFECKGKCSVTPTCTVKSIGKVD